MKKAWIESAFGDDPIKNNMEKEQFESSAGETALESKKLGLADENVNTNSFQVKIKISDIKRLKNLLSVYL